MEGKHAVMSKKTLLFGHFHPWIPYMSKHHPKLYPINWTLKNQFYTQTHGSSLGVDTIYRLMPNKKLLAMADPIFTQGVYCPVSVLLIV